MTEEGIEVARNVSGSAWDAPRRLVDQVVIGDSESEGPAFMLGVVVAVAANDDRVHVLPRGVHLLLRRDRALRHPLC